MVKIPRFINYDYFDRELTAMLQCNRHRHHNVVRLWYVSMPPPGTVVLPRLVMPLIDGVMLGSWLTDNIPDFEKASVRVASQVVEGVRHLQGVVGIIHGDLSMKNILIDRKHDHLVTLIDFGSARPVATGKSQRLVHGHYCFPLLRLCVTSYAIEPGRDSCCGCPFDLHRCANMKGLMGCPLPFQHGKDPEDVCAIAHLVTFWGQSRLFPYSKTFLQKAGDRIETIGGSLSVAITGKVAVAGVCLADPIISSRQSLAETLRHLNS